MKRNAARLFAIFCVLCLCLPTVALAAKDTPDIVPYSSDYITIANAKCVASSGGQIKITFDAYSNGAQNYLGVMRVTLYERSGGAPWHVLREFNWANHAGLMGYNTADFSGYKRVSGTVGCQYYASVVFWGGSSMTSGASRTVTTAIVTAQ